MCWRHVATHAPHYREVLGWENALQYREVLVLRWEKQTRSRPELPPLARQVAIVDDNIYHSLRFKAQLAGGLKSILGLNLYSNTCKTGPSHPIVLLALRFLLSIFTAIQSHIKHIALHDTFYPLALEGKKCHEAAKSRP